MDPTSVNSFLDEFLAVADAGFGFVAGDVTYVLNVLIIISLTLAAAQWVLAGDPPLAPFIRKILFVGFFAFLINNWQFLASAINESGALLGIRAGGSAITIADLHNPGRVAQIGIDLFGRTLALAEGMNIFSDLPAMFTILLSAIFVMIGFFILALQLFVVLIAFKLGSLAAFVALPWGVFNGTAWVAERPLGWVVGSAMRLFVLGFIASMCITFTNTLPQTFTMDTSGVLAVWLFGMTVIALAWFGPALASEVVQGQPHLSGQEVWRSTVIASAMYGGPLAIGAGKLFGWGIKKAWNAATSGGGGGRPRVGGGGGVFPIGGGPGGGGGGAGGAGAGRGGGLARSDILYARMKPTPAETLPPPSRALPSAAPAGLPPPSGGTLPPSGGAPPALPPPSGS
jgi:type IV secretion system protein TrbL